MNQSFLDPEKVNLKNLAEGAALERFDHELQKTLENIIDPNMDAIKKRTITLKVHLKPSAERAYANIEVECTSTLAPLSSFGAHVYIGKDVEGHAFAQQNHIKQQTFDDIPKTSTEDNKVTPIKGVK